MFELSSLSSVTDDWTFRAHGCGWNRLVRWWSWAVEILVFSGIVSRVTSFRFGFYGF